MRLLILNDVFEALSSTVLGGARLTYHDELEAASIAQSYRVSLHVEV